MKAARAVALLVVALTTASAWAVGVGQRGNLALIDGVPVALKMARGLSDARQVAQYRALGFNTLLITVDRVDQAAELDAKENLARAAERAGLYLMVELSAGDPLDARGWTAGKRPHPRDPAYHEVVSCYLDQAVPRFMKHANLIGWVVSTVDERQLVTETGTFSDYLEARYGTTERLNEAWTAKVLDVTGSGAMMSATTHSQPRIRSFKALNEGTARTLMNGNRGLQPFVERDLEAWKRGTEARDADFQGYLRARYATLADLNARWQFQFARWEDVSPALVEGREQQRPLSSPWSQLDLAQYRIRVQRELMELWARRLGEYDRGHLVFAGGQRSYRTMACLTGLYNGVVTECYPGVAEPDLPTHNPQAIDIARRGNRFIVIAGIRANAADTALTQGYLYEAAVHGAAGVAVDDWATLRGGDALARGVATTLTDIAERRLLGRTPSPSSAIVYSPYAAGPQALPRPLYGYLPRFYYQGPCNLINMLRTGTSFGQVDYLCAEDVDLETLRRYQTVILPSVLDFPEAAQLALTAFVEGGGTAVADLGLATVQATGDWTVLPQAMQDLFGVNVTPGLVEAKLNLEVREQSSRFPSLTAGQRATGIAEGYMILRTARATAHPTTRMLCAAVAQDAWTTRRPPRVTSGNVEAAGMYVRLAGTGHAVFATFPLYPFWLQGQLLFEEFHRDLLGLNAEVTLEQPWDFIPPFAEVATYTDGSVVAWTRRGLPPIVKVHAPWRQAFSGGAGICSLGYTRATLTARTAGLHQWQPQPVFLDRIPSPSDLTMTRNDENGLAFEVRYANAAQMLPAYLRVGTGRYPVTAESAHRVAIQTTTGTSEEVIVADAAGWLNITVPGPSARVMISPAGGMQKTPSLAVPAVPDAGERVIDVVPDVPEDVVIHAVPMLQPWDTVITRDGARSAG